MRQREQIVEEYDLDPLVFDQLEERDLLAKQAQGANASTLLAWMQQGGFQCDANLREPGAYDCTYRRHLLFDRVAELQARIVTNGTLLSTVTAPVPVFALGRTTTAALPATQTGG